MGMQQLFDVSKWRVTVEESFQAQKSLWKTTRSKEHLELWREAKTDKWWFYEIVGKFGRLYPYSTEQLAVSVQSERISKRLSKLKGAELLRVGKWSPSNRGTDEKAWRDVVFTLPISALDQAAVLIHAGRKRVLSPERRKKLANILEGLRNKRKMLSESVETRPKAADKRPQGTDHVQNGK